MTTPLPDLEPIHETSVPFILKELRIFFTTKQVRQRELAIVERLKEILNYNHKLTIYAPTQETMIKKLIAELERK
jgi:hypothetical protein